MEGTPLLSSRCFYSITCTSSTSYAQTLTGAFYSCLLCRTDSTTCEICLYIFQICLLNTFLSLNIIRKCDSFIQSQIKVLPVVQIIEIFLVYHPPLLPLHCPLWPPPSAHLYSTLCCIRAGPRGRDLTARVQGSVCV